MPGKVTIPPRLGETGTLTAENFDWTSVFLRRIRPLSPGFPYFLGASGTDTPHPAFQLNPL